MFRIYCLDTIMKESSTLAENRHLSPAQYKIIKTCLQDEC